MAVGSIAIVLLAALLVLVIYWIIKLAAWTTRSKRPGRRGDWDGTMVAGADSSAVGAAGDDHGSRGDAAAYHGGADHGGTAGSHDGGGGHGGGDGGGSSGGADGGGGGGGH